MTGTPISEKPLNCYPLIKFCEPKLVVSKTKFDAYFVAYKDYYYGGQKVRKVDHYKNLDKLRELLAYISIRRTVVEGMPLKNWVRREVELPAAHRKAYNDLIRKIRNEISGLNSVGMPKVKNVTLRLRQFLNDPKILGIDLPSVKYDIFEEMADEILEDPQAKIVCWTNFIEPMPRLLSRFAKYNPMAIYEKTTNEEIDHLSRTFDHSGCRMIFATPAKGGTGLDMLSRARYAVYIDLPWSVIQFKQSQDRLIRRIDIQSTDPIEQLKGTPATLFELYTPGTPDALVRSILDRKIDLIERSDASVDSLELSRAEFLEFLQEIK